VFFVLDFWLVQTADRYWGGRGFRLMLLESSQWLVVEESRSTEGEASETPSWSAGLEIWWVT
jgi:hypothetical protein